jgi:hypothetical protein
LRCNSVPHRKISHAASSSLYSLEVWNHERDGQWCIGWKNRQWSWIHGAWPASLW